MKLKLTILLLLCAFAPQGLLAGPPQTETQKLVDSMDAEGGVFGNCIWGVYAVDMNGRTLASLNPRRLMVPASNMKVVTTAGALLTCGERFCFSTRFATDGQVVDSTLVGNLYVIGGGDPTIGNVFPYLPSPASTFRKWAAVLAGKGIRHIQGDIVGDGRHYMGAGMHGDWSTEDLLVKDGVVPDGLTWRGAPGDSLPDGAYSAVWHFREWLRESGTLKVDGGVRAVDKRDTTAVAADSLLLLGSVKSAGLGSLITTANHYSDNFIAETLLKELGLRFYSSDDYDKATAGLRRSLSPIKMMQRSGTMRFADGSGLSRKNYLSPEFIVGVLKGMASSRCYQTYLKSLPQPGAGTLKYRLKAAPADVRSRIRMKSGSMNGNRCFSGYILSGDKDAGRTIAFCILVNNFVKADAEFASSLDALITKLAEENK